MSRQSVPDTIPGRKKPLAHQRRLCRKMLKARSLRRPSAILAAFDRNIVSLVIESKH
jgi:hypothetical protein